MTPDMDIHKIIEARRESLGLTKYELVHRVLDGVPKGVKLSERTIYNFLAGNHDLNSTGLGYVLDVLQLTIKPK